MEIKVTVLESKYFDLNFHLWTLTSKYFDFNLHLQKHYTVNRAPNTQTNQKDGLACGGGGEAGEDPRGEGLGRLRLRLIHVGRISLCL